MKCNIFEHCGLWFIVAEGLANLGGFKKHEDAIRTAKSLGLLFS